METVVELNGQLFFGKLLMMNDTFIKQFIDKII